MAVAVVRTAQDIWVKQLPSGPFSRITFGDTVQHAADLDRGRPLGAVHQRSGHGRRADDHPGRRDRGARDAARAMLFGQVVQTADGKWLVLRRSFAEPGAGDLYAVRTGDSTLVPLLTGPAREMSPAVSPDGRWLAYVSDESGRDEVYVRPFPDVASARWQVSAAAGRCRCGRGTGASCSTSARRGDDERESRAGDGVHDQRAQAALPDRAILAGRAGAVVRRDPDGKRFLMLRETTPTERNELIVVQNWVEEMEARARR